MFGRSALLLAALIAVSYACSSKMMGGGGCGCGGGGGGGGGCGCRSKARGVLRLEGDSAVEEDFGEIFGLRMWESRKLAANVTIGQATDPNFLFRSCCAERNLPSACHDHCNFASYNQNILQNMLVGSDACPLSALPEMHFCAAQGRDHTACCRQRGVDKVAAGDKCLLFCDQIPDKFTPIDYTYASCFSKFDDMKQCFYNDVQQKAKAFFSGKSQL